MTKTIGDLAGRIMAEQATGIPQPTKGLGKYYISESLHVQPESAFEMLKTGRAMEIHVPNAGAGSYQEFFRSIGITELKPFDQCSSAGDWVFGVKVGNFWHPAFQTNRHPRPGFSYSIQFEHPYDTYERLYEHALK